MKGIKNFKIIKIVFYSFLIGGVVLFYTGLKLEIEKKTKEKINLEEILFAKKNENTMLLVEVQKMKAGDRIITIAESKLGLSKYSLANSVIEIDSNEAEQILKLISSKYE